MQRHLPAFKCVSFYVKVLFVFLFVSLYFTGASEKKDSTVKTLSPSKNSIFTLHTVQGVNLKKLNRKIGLRKIPNMGLIKKKDFPATPQGKIEWKLTVILARVQNLLNMYPKRMRNINIKIYPNLKHIKKYLNRYTTHKADSFYNKKTNTVHISAKKCDEYILAHEIAHVVISHYFVVQAPISAQEVLAIYCDSHLKDQSIFLEQQIQRK